MIFPHNLIMTEEVQQVVTVVVTVVASEPEVVSLYDEEAYSNINP
jgi:hypothetical protein